MTKLRLLCPEQCDKVFGQQYADIDGDFLGFVDTYYYLSKLIPKHWIVIDFGCAYAPQAYYFRKHKEYIGICPSVDKRFFFENTTHCTDTIKGWLEKAGKMNTDEVFAICNYVPSPETELVRQTFKNCYVFYPHGDFKALKNEKTK